MKTRAGRVLLSGQLVGVIEELDDKISFAYSPEWLARADAVPVSLTLPLLKDGENWVPLAAASANGLSVRYPFPKVLWRIIPSRK